MELIILQALISAIAILGGVAVACMGLSIIFIHMTVQAFVVGVFSVLSGGCLIIIGILVSTF